MKTVQKEIINYKTIYEAFDGTTFEDNAECEKYEKSAMGLMKSRVVDMAIGPWTTEYEMFEMGSDDNQAILVQPKNKADIDTLRHAYLLAGGRKDAEKAAPDSFIGRPVIMFFGYNDDCVWFRSLDGLIADIAGDGFHLVPNTDKQ